MSTHNINVTDLIHSFVAPFDKEFWSGVKALERLIPKDRWQVEKKSVLSKHKIDTDLLMLYDISETDFNREKQNVLDQWQKSKQDACDRGTIIHKQLEDSFKGGKQTLERFGLGGKFEFMNEPCWIIRCVNQTDMKETIFYINLINGKLDYVTSGM